MVFDHLGAWHAGFMVVMVAGFTRRWDNPVPPAPVVCPGVSWCVLVYLTAVLVVRVFAPMSTEEWITKAQAVTRYRVSLSTLNRLLSTGEVGKVKRPHVRPSVHVSVADLERTLAPEVHP